MGHDLPSTDVPAAARITDVDVATLTDFLGSCPPFDALEPDELARIVAHAVVERYDAGAVIVDAFDSASTSSSSCWRAGSTSGTTRTG